MPKSLINAKLRELRVKSGYTQHQIADILNIDRSTYTYYETGKTSPDITVLAKLSKIFNVSIDELFSYDDEIGEVADRRVRKYEVGQKNASRIYDLSSQEKDLIGSFRVCTPAEKAEILRYIRQKNRKV